MGAISKTEIFKPLQSVVEGMNKGDVSSPIKTEDGIYILYLADKRGPQEINKDYEYSLSQISVPLNKDIKDVLASYNFV